MLTRTAIYEGRIKAGHEDEFFRAVDEKLEPVWRQFPHIRAMRVQRTVSRDSETPPIAMIMEMDFPDQAAMRDCLASPIRERAHAATEEVMKLFEGRFYHLVAEAAAFGPADENRADTAPTAG